MSKAYLEIKKQIPSEVGLIAVTKFRQVEEIQALIACGQKDFGENKVQLLIERCQALPDPSLRWHLIGHLQTNKVKQILPYCWMIHSVDSEKLLHSIEKEAAKIQKKIKVLLQIKVAQEESKYGFSWNELVSFLQHHAISSFPHIEICGVMGMATLTDNKEQIRSEFKTLSGYFQQLKTRFFSDSTAFKEISMGMSGDYLIALEEGSTLLRIGSALFLPH